MERIAGQPILSAAQMREVEARAAPDAASLYALMERAGRGVADATRRIAAGADVLVLCGPGNNGGDGYVAARILREGGVNVRVAASAPPKSELAAKARAAWNGPTFELDPDQGGETAPVLVDALFGTGLSRSIDRETLFHFGLVAGAAKRRLAVDLPSGMGSDEAEFWYGASSAPPAPHTTLALGALKPVHVLPSAPLQCGEVRLIDLGLDLSRWPVRVNDRPSPPALSPEIHKYRRGMIGIVAGEMPGAALLAATAAARAGAGYVVIFGDAPPGLNAFVHRPLTEEALADERLGAVVIGPGLGRGEAAQRWLRFLVTKTQHRLVIDADALHVLERDWLEDRRDAIVLTPHHGEYETLMKRFGVATNGPGSMIDRSLAERDGLGCPGPMVMVRKGFTTYIVGWNGVRVQTRASTWLSTAGTGDVLAGAIGATLGLYGNHGQSSFDAAAAGVWLHAEAAGRLGPAFVADDLAEELRFARADV